MVFAADFNLVQVFWSLFWFFVFVLWIWLVISVFGDIIRSDDLSGWGKAAWAVLIVVLPYLGVFLYLVVRGSSMGRRNVEAARRQEEAAQAYIR